MAVVSAIIPVFLIILCGYLCRYFKFPDPDFWRGAEKITYFLLFPALLGTKMATADLSTIAFVKPIIVIFLLYAVATLLLFFVKPFVRLADPQFTSVYQGSIRFNTYIGLAVVASLYGAPGLVAAVVLASIMIPTINVCCVLVLEYYNHQSGGRAGQRILKSIVTNPLILACIIGMSINVTGLVLPEVVMEALTIFSRAALPLGLLTVGAALALDTLKSALKPLVLASAAKFFVLPLLAMSLCDLFAIEPLIRDAMLVLTILPTATASYVLARQLGGDYHLMATIITAQTLLGVVLMPLMLVTLGG
jgi:predicted permease